MKKGGKKDAIADSERLEREIEKAHRKAKVLMLGGIGVCVVFLGLLTMLFLADPFAVEYSRADGAATSTTATSTFAADTPAAPATLDTAAYDQKLIENANCPQVPVAAAVSASSTGATTAAIATNSPAAATSTVSTAPKSTCLWPVKTAYPDAGAIFPFNRVVAYYGNFYSTKMGVLGEYPPQQMLQMLQSVVAQWQAADPSTPVIPALDYIAVTAQGSPDADGYYNLRMPASQVDEAISLANQVHGLVILDVQVGTSNLQTELPLLAAYLAQPNVELAIDPEFSMKDGAVPGTEIGTFSSTDINYAANFLANIVQQDNLPPKFLVVHRFTQDMVTGYQNIQPLPQVQIVMDMDGWGSQPKKLNTYQQFIADQPVQFTGFKLFYVNDLKPPSTGMLTPAQLLKLTPQPLFIQYQ